MKKIPLRALKRVVVLGLVASMPLAIAGCGSSDSDSDAGQQTESSNTADPSDVCTEDKVDAAGKLTVSTFFPTQSLDPATAPGGFAGGTELSAIYDTLMRYNPETGNYDPFVAESLAGNDDSTEWTLKLRSGITFGNGDPLTAQDVKYSIERLKTAPVAAAAYANMISSLDVVDDLTVVYHLVRPWGQFAVALAGEPGMVVNKKVVDAQGDTFATNPVGAGVGPYEPVKLAPGEETTMKAKTDYWGGPVCVGNLRFVFVPGDKAQFEAFQKGEVDTVSLSDPVVIHDFQEADGVADLTALISGYGVGMNSRPDSPFSDVRLRQAVAQAINPDIINDRAFSGYGIMASGLTAPDMRIYSGVDGLPYDPDAAKGLVEDAKADGVDTNVTLMCSDTTNQDYVLAVQAMLDQVGFNVETDILSTTDSLAKLQAGSFQVTCGATLTRDDSPLRQLSQLTSDSPANRYGFADPDLDEAINQVYLARDVEEVQTAMAQVQEVWNEVQPMAPVYVQTQLVGFHDNVHGLYLGNDSKLGFEKVYIGS